MRNLEAKLPGEVWREVKGAAYAAYQGGSPKLAELARDDFVMQYERDYPSATACFLDDFEACIAHLQLPIAHRRVTPTTNLLERAFGEERRRTKIIPHAFGERAVLKLMYAALIRASETWRRVVISEFELKQLEQLREHLNKRHAERTAPVGLGQPVLGQLWLSKRLYRSSACRRARRAVQPNPGAIHRYHRRWRRRSDLSGNR
jgi:hypothetical protein